MKDATLTDVTCIEELLKKFIANDTFEKEVFRQLWVSYSNAQTVENGFQNTEGIAPSENIEEHRRQLREARLEQRAAIQLLRMIGSSKPKILIDHKKVLMDSSLKFAAFENPDFIIMKEAILAFERMLLT